MTTTSGPLNKDQQYRWNVPLTAHENVVTVVRAEELQVKEEIDSGALLYIRGPRKIGKTTLLLRLAHCLSAGVPNNFCLQPRHTLSIKFLDLLGDTNSFREAVDRRLEREFFALAARADIAVDHAKELRARSGDSIVWFWDAVSALAKETNGIAILVDEVEGLLHQREVGEAWLTALRAVHSEFDCPPKLSVCLFAMLPMSELVRSPTRTPFNTAREIVLPDFSEREVESMVGPLRLDVNRGPAVARAIYGVTSGHPHLSQCLFGALKHAFSDDRKELAYGYRRFIDEFIKTEREFCDPTSNAYMHIDEIFSPTSTWPSVIDALDAHRQMLERYSQRILFDSSNRAHQTLEAIGLAKIVAEDGERYLMVRNSIVTRIFDVDWTARRRAILSGVQDQIYANANDSVHRGSRDDALHRLEALARERLCETEENKRRKLEIRNNSGRVIVKDTLFQFHLTRRAPDERLTLQLFIGVGDLGGLLWRRQVRTLRRLSGIGRSALPVILEGGVFDGTNIAYVLTRRPDGTLDEDFAVDWFRDHRAVAVREFRALAEALDELSGQGIVHRNVWPGSVGYEVFEGGDDRILSLVGFEFAVMMRSLVHGSDRDRRDGIIRERRQALREAFLAQPHQSHIYAPPERIGPLFSTEPAGQIDGPTSDVFSLGMIGISWFVAALDTDDFVDTLSIGDELRYDETRHALFVELQHEKINEARRQRRIPADLARLLLDMTAFNPRERLRPDAVVERLQEHDARLDRWATGYSLKKVRLVCYSYRDTAKEFANWGLISSAIGSDDSRAVVHQLLESELGEATLYHTARGFSSYVDQPDDRHRKAQWVLEGRTLVFFCNLFERRRSGFAAAGQPVRHVLRIAFPYLKRRAWDQKPLQRVRVPDLELVEQSSHLLDAEFDKNYASWDGQLSLVKGLVQRPWVEVSLAALEWLVRAQNEERELQRFPVIERGATSDGNKIYELDRRAYQEFIDSDTLRSIVYRNLNIADPADYFQRIFDAALAEGDVEVELFDRTWRSGRRRYTAYLRQSWQAGVTIQGSDLLPKAAHLALGSRRLAQEPLRRQAGAIVDLGRDRTLHQQLLEPRDLIREHVLLRDLLPRLDGRAPEVVQRIISTEPFFAVQGPPGTGKTEVVSRCVREFLDRDKTLRLLITSQSHAALDNIAIRILGDLGDSATAVRVAADWAFERDLVHPSLKGLRSGKIAAKLCRAIERRCAEYLEADFGKGVLHEKALRQLSETARAHQNEIAERVEEAANLVFTTTAGTGRLALGRFLVNGRFDLAVVEEASKAWPTEIIQPLLLADRYLLIGDHKQLPAYGSIEIDKLLQKCIATHPEEFRVLASYESAVRGWLALFKSFFEVDNHKIVPDASTAPNIRRDQVRLSVDRLDEQYRMRKPIADVVSVAFYDGALNTASKVDARSAPDWLERVRPFKESVVWIDTGAGGGRFAANPTWYNVGEALLAARFVAGLIGGADISDEEARRRVAVLSPFRRQNEQIAKELQSLVGFDSSNLVHTVDSFQGQEAEAVVISLVRMAPSHRRRGRASAISKYGFLTSAERINVMFSRARELEIVIGDFNFFRDATGSETAKREADLVFWRNICDTVRKVGCVIQIGQLPSGYMTERS
jgi:AAA domain/AAA-like domain